MRRNIRHGQERRHRSVLLPSTLLVVLTGLLVWELTILFGGA